MKKKQNIEPDIYEIRKEEATRALTIAKETDPDVFLGELNEQYFYLVVKEEENARKIQSILAEKEIITEREYRYMCENYALNIQDKKESEVDGNVEE